MPVPVVVVHGGAGRWSRERLEKAVPVLVEAARRGLEVIERGGSALDAVVEAVTVMEASGCLNAGRGACRDASGGVSLDAGVMWMGRAGAVAHVRATWNAVRLARIVLDETRHVLIAGDGADELAARHGLPAMDTKGSDEVLPDDTSDTVGAVALDKEGRLAAATSTGGIRGKMKGRVGDTPIPGAGFWASRAVALSSTGIGEAIIMAQTCRLAAMLYESTMLELSEALLHACRATKGACGVIAVDIYGKAAAATTADYMPIAVARPGKTEHYVLVRNERKAL